MELTEIIDILNRYWGLIVGAFGILGIGIERSTWIKINPYSALFEWIGRRINKETRDELSQLSQRVCALQEKFDNHIIETEEVRFKEIRAKILGFAQSLREGKKHTLKQFEDIFDLYAEYHVYLDKNEFPNGFCDAEYEYIVLKFKECQRYNSFLDSEREE